MASIIQTALCAYGMSGKVFHAPFLHVHEGFHFRGVYERSTKRAQHDYADVQSYDSMEAMLADDAVQLVVVNTPNASHFEYARQALLAGKHVLVEKPFVVQRQQADELAALAAQQQRIISVYHNRRYDSDF